MFQFSPLLGVFAREALRITLEGCVVTVIVCWIHLFMFALMCTNYVERGMYDCLFRLIFSCAFCFVAPYAGYGVKVLPERYHWKGCWSSANSKPGVPRTQNAIEGKNTDLARHSAMNKRQVVTSYIPNLAKYINQESLTMVNQPSKVFKHVPTIENVDWRGAQILSESFLLSCAFEKPAVGGSAGILIVIPSTAFFKETCERNHIDTLVVKDSRRASAGALIKTKLSDEVDLFVKLVQNSPAETRLWRHDLTDLLTYLKKFYILKLRDVPNGEFLLFDCSCPRFRMKAKCKHAVAAGMYTGKFRVPTEKSLQIIKRKAKAGRPKKNIHPWQRLESDDEEPEQEEESDAEV